MKYLAAIVLSVIFSFAHASETPPDFAALYATHSSSVVTVYTTTVSRQGNVPRASRGLGSGVVIKEDRILTAAHVVEGAHTIEVQFVDGARIKADVIASLESSDIALLRLRQSHPDPQIATLADSDLTRVGSQVFVIGSPFGISQTLSVGYLSGRMERGLHAGGTPIEFLQTDTAINTGNSGGPMFNTAGEVIGVVSFILTKSGGFDGIGFATSSNTAKQALLSSSGVLAGFEGIMLDDRMAKALNYPVPGMLVQRVVGDSIIGRAGLRAGDVHATIEGQSLLLGGDLILEINGMACRTPHDFELVRTASLELHEEDSYSISVFRDGAVVELIAGEQIAGLFDFAR